MEIVYGIIIGALIGSGMFIGGWLTLKLKALPDWRAFRMQLPDTKENGESEASAYPSAGKFTPFNIEDTSPPKSAEEMAARFRGRNSYHEDVKRDTAKQ